MPRLRTTASLSVLALALGVGGTAALTAWPRWHDYADATVASSRTPPPPRASKSAPPRRRLQHAAKSLVPPAVPAPPRPPPRIVSMSSPRYPVEAARAHREGVVTLRVQVNMAGQVVSVGVAHSSGDAQMDASARKAVLQWRFQTSPSPPAVLTLPVRFKLGTSDANG